MARIVWSSVARDDLKSLVSYYSQVGNLENTVSLSPLFYAGPIGVFVVLIADH